MKNPLDDNIHEHFRHPIYAVLNDKGIFTVREMIALSDKELKRIRNVGKKTMIKINDFRSLLLGQ
jgi:DNA-directed RNA polymerase alpha subunit